MQLIFAVPVAVRVAFSGFLRNFAVLLVTLRNLLRPDQFRAFELNWSVRVAWRLEWRKVHLCPKCLWRLHDHCP